MGIKSESAQFQGPAPRLFELIVGCVAALVGLGLLAFGALGFHATFFPLDGDPVFGALAIPVFVVLALGTLMSLFAWRLLSGRGRSRDEGLLSPTGLRLSSVIFGLGPVAAWFIEPLGLLHTVTLLAAAAACWGLARRRERQVASHAA